jgi:hypothetical protein
VYGRYLFGPVHRLFCGVVSIPLLLNKERKKSIYLILTIENLYEIEKPFRMDGSTANTVLLDEF